MLSSFFEAALRSLTLAVLVWTGLRAFRIHNVIYQRLAWTTVLAGALLMPFLLPFTARWAALSVATIPAAAPIHRLKAALSPTVTSEAPVAVRSSIRGPIATITAQAAPLQRSHGTSKAVAAITHVDSASIDLSGTASLHVLDMAPPTHARLHFSVFRIIALAYLLIATALLARLLLGFLSAFRLWRSATPIAAGSSAFFDADLKLRTSHKVCSPVTIGSGIVLPTCYTSWTEEKLRIVLAHERSHVIQRDFYLLTLASLYTAATWFSPLGWWLKHKLSDLGEAISDRSGLNAASNRSAYAQILLEFAAAPRPTLIGVAMARPSNISRRIERLLNDSYLRHAFSGSGHARVAVLLVPIVLFAGAALVRVEAATQSNQAPSADGVIAPTSPRAPVAPDIATLPTSPSVPAQAVPPAAPASSDLATPGIPPSAPGEVISPVSADSIAALPPAPPRIARLAPMMPLAPPAASSDNNVSWQGTFDRSLSVSGKLDLAVSTGSGNIKITRGSSGQVHVHGVVKVYRDGDTAKGQELASNPPIEQNGDTVHIGTRHENLRNIEIDYEIEMPADSALNATSGSGDIEDNGVGQDAKLTTGSGNITASGLENGFNIVTGSGNINVDGSGQGDAKVQTGSGEIDVKGVHGGLWAQTGSGGIKVAGTPSAPWKLQTGSGDIELNTGSAPMNLDVSTGSGEISSSQPMTMESSENHHHQHAQINGGGPDVVAQTGSGDIRVR